MHSKGRGGHNISKIHFIILVRVDCLKKMARPGHIWPRFAVCGARVPVSSSVEGNCQHCCQCHPCQFQHWYRQYSTHGSPGPICPIVGAGRLLSDSIKSFSSFPPFSHHHSSSSFPSPSLFNCGLPRFSPGESTRGLESAGESAGLRGVAPRTSSRRQFQVTTMNLVHS